MRPPHYAGENIAVATRVSSCFNEAPALRGGKPGRRGAAGAKRYRFNEAPALRGGKRGHACEVPRLCPASMRPPHYAGENVAGSVITVVSRDASMRPPHYAGENAPRQDGVGRVGVASMRPPHYAGENRKSQIVRTCDIVASMRPPHYAGENAHRDPAPGLGSRCFNEAPALRGGKPAAVGV